jgi:hypothetical protein
VHLKPIQASTARPIGHSRPKRVEAEPNPSDTLTLSWPGAEHTPSAAPQPSGWIQRAQAIRNPADPAAQASFSRQEISQILTVGAGLRRISGSLSAEARQILEKHPEVPALLAGVLPAVILPVSNEGFDELVRVVDAFSVSTGQSIEIGQDPAQPDKAILVHNSAVEGVAPHLIQPNRQQFRFQWNQWNPQTRAELGTVELDAPQNPLGPIAVLDPDAEAKQAQLAKRLGDFQNVLENGCGARPPAPTTPGKIGMISYVSSDYQFKRLEAVLHDWQGNLEAFGHHHVSLRLCDDSPQPFSDKIKALIQQMNEQGPNTFHYLGPEEKAQLRSQLKQDLKGELSARDAEAVATLVAGAGPTQNRNLSLQLLGSSGGLQVDHDMTAEVLTKHFEHPLPYDLLGALEAAPQDQLSSLRFSGAEDHSIDSILKAKLPSPQRADWITQENREPNAPARRDTLDDKGMGGGLRAPMHVPQGFSSGSRISPGLRDGDLALGSVAEVTGGQHPEELNRSIHHRDAAGSRWGGASLLKEFLKFATVHYVFKGLEQGGVQPRELGKQLVEASDRKADALHSFDQLWYAGTTRGAVQEFLSERGDKVNQLKDLLARSPYPSKLESWQGDKLTPKLRKQSAQEVRMIIQKLEDESQEMREKLHVGPDGHIDAQALTADLHQDVRQILRAHGLALTHSQQIAASLQKATLPKPG